MALQNLKLLISPIPDMSAFESTSVRDVYSDIDGLCARNAMAFLHAQLSLRCNAPYAGHGATLQLQLLRMQLHAAPGRAPRRYH